MVTNSELAALFDELALLARIADGSPQSFRARAYEAVARTLEGLPQDVAGMTQAELRRIPGVGKSTAARIHEYLRTGTITQLEKLRANYPPEYQELVRIPGLGPKRAATMRRLLGVDSVASLVAALEAESIRELPGFGPKTEQNLRRAITRLGWSGKERRTPILTAMREANRLVGELQALPGVERAAYCGSLRRFCETVADLDLLVATDDSAPVAERLAGMGWVRQVLGSGQTKTSVITHSGLQVDVRMVPERQWGAALLYFTGSKEHNIRLRRLAIERDWVLSEYALYHSESGAVVAQETEQDIYQALGLPWIPPTIREDRGEIEAAQSGSLPDLVADGDLRGDLHVHTDLSGDGDHSLEAMVETAAGLGLEYLAITDHAENLAINGVGRREMLAQRRRMAILQDRYPTLRLLHGVELNIGRDGSLDYDYDFLMGYDWCVASVHSHFDLPVQQQTARLLRAMEHPAVDVIGHPLGRRIGRRPGIEVDVANVLDAAESTGTALEINSHLDRLDAPVEVLLRARGRSVYFVISTDAHRTSELEQSRWGIPQAQRGWVERRMVANTWPIRRFLDWRRRRRPG